MADRGIPLISPLHDGISGNERGDDIEDLGLRSSPGVEDGVVEGTGKRALTVGREEVGSDTPLRGGATCYQSARGR